MCIVNIAFNLFALICCSPQPIKKTRKNWRWKKRKKQNGRGLVILSSLLFSNALKKTIAHTHTWASTPDRNDSKTMLLRFEKIWSGKSISLFVYLFFCIFPLHSANSMKFTFISETFLFSRWHFRKSFFAAVAVDAVQRLLFALLCCILCTVYQSFSIKNQL